MTSLGKDYYKVRLTYDPGRAKVWRAINEYLQKYVTKDATILDLGSGYGDFINGIVAKKKYALDLNSNSKNQLSQDIIFINGKSDQLSDIPVNSVDIVFSSNLFEHLDKVELDKTIKALAQRLKKKGKLILMGPNFKYAYKDYFDDYTHKTIYTHISLTDTMYEYGFAAIKVIPKFLPLTLHSYLPKSYILTKAYLHAPISPFGKQMLLVLELNQNAKK